MHQDIILKGFTNAGKELKVYCETNFSIGSQLQFLDEAQDKYCPLTIGGTYTLKTRKSKITTDLNGYILSIDLMNEKPTPRTKSKFYKLNTTTNYGEKSDQ